MTIQREYSFPLKHNNDIIPSPTFPCNIFPPLSIHLLQFCNPCTHRQNNLNVYCWGIYEFHKTRHNQIKFAEPKNTNFSQRIDGSKHGWRVNWTEFEDIKSMAMKIWDSGWMGEWQGNQVVQKTDIMSIRRTGSEKCVAGKSLNVFPCWKIPLYRMYFIQFSESLCSCSL